MNSATFVILAAAGLFGAPLLLHAIALFLL